MPSVPTIQLRDFCAVFDFQDREVRYLLERGHVPPGVAEQPDTGNRREFGPEAAFWLAIAVLLRRNGIQTAVAAEIASSGTQGVQRIAQNLGWDPGFWPAGGFFQTENVYLLDVGDRKYVRMMTTSPSKDDLEQFGWLKLNTRSQKLYDLEPLVILRLDLRQITRVLATVEGWNRARG